MIYLYIALCICRIYIHIYILKRKYILSSTIRCVKLFSFCLLRWLIDAIYFSQSTAINSYFFFWFIYIFMYQLNQFESYNGIIFYNFFFYWHIHFNFISQRVCFIIIHFRSFMYLVQSLYINIRTLHENLMKRPSPSDWVNFPSAWDARSGRERETLVRKKKKKEIKRKNIAKYRTTTRAIKKYYIRIFL